MDHAITVGDVLLASVSLIGLLLLPPAVMILRNYLQYRRELKAYLNRPYDSQEG